MSQSKKKLKKKIAKKSSVKNKVSIQDDPYWGVSNMYLDSHRLGRYVTKFEQFERKRPEWADDLFNGVPTYYCVLGVERGATNKQTKQAYDKKNEISIYPRATIQEAFKVLSSSKLRAEYDKLLDIFKQITKCMPPLDKIELIRSHKHYIESEQDYVKMGNLLDTYREYQYIYVGGMPDLYELMQITQDSPVENIIKYTNSDSGLLRIISNFLSDPTSREEYDFVLYFTKKYMGDKYHALRAKQKVKWDIIDETILEKIIYTSLYEDNKIFEYINRFIDIRSKNQDWTDYIPPNETFFSLLGVDMDLLTEDKDKREIEFILRDKYRKLEKTAPVNLAYSMLKNTSKRDDYLWFAENYDWINTLDNLMPDLSNIQTKCDEYDEDDEYEDDEIMDILDGIMKKIMKIETDSKK